VTKLSSESRHRKLYYCWYIESCIIDVYTSTICGRLLKLLLEHYVANILVNYVAHNVFLLNWLWTYLLMTGALLFFALLGLSGCFITCYDRRVRNDLAQPCRELCLCCCQPGYALVSSFFNSSKYGLILKLCLNPEKHWPTQLLWHRKNLHEVTWRDYFFI
jgi:hypothetical protein